MGLVPLSRKRSAFPQRPIEIVKPLYPQQRALGIAILALLFDFCLEHKPVDSVNRHYLFEWKWTTFYRSFYDFVHCQTSIFLYHCVRTCTLCKRPAKSNAKISSGFSTDKN
jgi:hypothetical protein